MKEITQQEIPLFVESFKNHQRLVTILAEAKNEKGISCISQSEIASLMNRSQSWVTKAINRLNNEDQCIELVAPGKYVVYYTNISAQGVFSEIFKLFIACRENPDIIFIKESEIALERGINAKTVQMFKNYIRTGWKKTLILDRSLDC